VRKLEIEHIRKEFESKQWKLPNQNYLGSGIPLDAICPNGHQTKKSVDTFRRGSGCLTCSGSEKKEIEEIRIAFDQKGWKLLEKEYKGNKRLLNAICPNGHETKIRWNSFANGRGCVTCAGLERKTIEYVKSSFEKEGWQLLDTEYTNSRVPLRVICPNGHETKKAWSDFQQGQRCIICAGLERKTIEWVRSAFESKGWQLLDTGYTNSFAPLRVICPNGHETKKNWADFNSGYGCNICFPSGFNPDLSGILYYLRFAHDFGYFYKIGITNRTIKKRFHKEPKPYKIIHQEFFSNGQDARNKEAEILAKYKKHKYHGEPFLRDGNTELFTVDVLGLDTEIYAQSNATGQG
jgi:hypothetical protein